MGRLKSVALFEAAGSCIDRGFEEPMPCCEDISEEWKVDELTQTSFDFEIDPGYHLLATTIYLIEDQTQQTKEFTNTKYKNFAPPLIDRDIPVLVQSFLI